MKSIRKRSFTRNIDVLRLRDKEVREAIILDINDKLSQIPRNDTDDANDQCNKLNQILLKTGMHHLKTSVRVRKRKWMTEEILDLMEKRRLLKHDITEYRKLQNTIRKAIRTAKTRWMTEKCEEMEDLIRKNDLFGTHRKAKEIAGLYKKRIPMTLLDSSNKIILQEEEKIRAWESYMATLFGDTRPSLETNEDRPEGPHILKSEVLHAIEIAKNRKSTGPDGVPMELIKIINEDNIDLVVNLFNNIYDSGKIPEEWLTSTFVPIPKKQHPKRCSDYRLISLMNHMLKTFLRIIHARIRSKCEQDLDDSQFGFRQAFGTREALFSFNVLMQKCRDQRRDVFACFIDYEKAFDRVQHVKMVEMLRAAGVDGKDTRLIENLYWYQRGEVRVEHNKTSELEIQRGVRQGCVLSPLLFNLYADRIFKRALDGLDLGIKIGGVRISTIKYADDTVVMAESVGDLQLLLDRIKQEGDGLGLNINISKTKFMVISRQEHNDATIYLDGEQVERVKVFKYLGSLITESLDPDREVKCRIETARAVFNKMKSLYCDNSLNFKTRLRMVKCYVWSVLLYGAEAWTLKINTMNRLEAFEMWLLRRMLRISWIERVTNGRVLERAGTDRMLLSAVKCRKVAYLGHVLRGEKYRLLQLIMKGKVEGRRGIGRKRMSWLKNIREWTGIRSAEELFRMAENRSAYAEVIANVGRT